MHDRSSHIEARLERMLEHRIRPAVVSERLPLTVTAWEVPGEPVPFEEATGPGASYEPFTPGTKWGPAWSTLWLHVTGEVPASWAGRHAEVHIDPGFAAWPGTTCEGLVLTPDGTPVKGLNPYNFHVFVSPGEPGGGSHRTVRGGEQVDWFVELAANPDILDDNRGNTPQSDVLTRRAEPVYTFKHADIVTVHPQVWHLGIDLTVLGDLMKPMSAELPRKHEIAMAIERALDTLDYDDIPGTAEAARAELRDVLDRPAHASAHRISAIGNSHIDTAWLWPLRETVRKIGRTFANTIALLPDYPEYLFAGPQAQQFAWAKETHPITYGRIKEAVADGTWLPVGGAWVEADGNVPGGESLARQLVYGKRFFAEEFGVETRGVWLPDSFGYTAAYPQIAALARNDWFLTQKISWNQTNTFPHHTFWWEGIDGTRIFTHFPPADTYTGEMTVEDLQRAWTGFRDKGPATRSLYPFGYGDGGGGPVRDMLEARRRFANLEGAPRIEIESPDTFFDAAKEEYADQAPVWSGELYLELHRGTLTSQARGKQGNRRCEHLLRELELWASTAAIRSRGEYAYPYAELDRIWKRVLTLQFHDILPGSSIAWVHREAEAEYVELIADLEELMAEAAAALGYEQLPAHGEAATEIAVLNASPFDRREVLSGTPGREAALVAAPASGIGQVVQARDSERVTLERDGESIVLDNGLVRVTITGGLVTGLRDLRTQREVLPAGQVANLLQVHPDIPNDWEAWDLDEHYRHRSTDLTHPESVEVVADGPLEKSVRVVFRHKDSTITQELVLKAASARLDVRTHVDWQNSEKILKAAFPLDVHAETVRSEIQYGHVQRTTHENTSWEAARFEMCAHRWIHVGETAGAGGPGFGVALLTDSTYGHDVSRGSTPAGGRTTTVRLSLLRAPVAPDPKADLGEHRFTYSILPAGLPETIQEAYALNLPLRVVQGRAACETPRPGATVEAPLVSLDDHGSGVTVEAVKLADDGSGDLVVRCYEAYGTRGSATLTLTAPIGTAEVTDLLEAPIDAETHPELAARHDGVLRQEGQSVVISLRPFQVVTLRLALTQ